jgi:hypothetical protein
MPTHALLGPGWHRRVEQLQWASYRLGWLTPWPTSGREMLRLQRWVGVHSHLPRSQTPYSLARGVLHNLRPCIRLLGRRDGLLRLMNDTDQPHHTGCAQWSAKLVSHRAHTILS